MSTTAAPSPASTVAPVTPVATPAAPAKPAPTAVAPATTTPATPPKPSPGLEAGLADLSSKVFAPKATEPTNPSDSTPAKPEGEAKPVIAVEAEKPSKEKGPLDHIAEPKGMTPENLNNWKAWKKDAEERINAARAEKDSMASQLEVLKKGAPADAEESARTREELKQARDALAVHDLKTHPDFARQYIEPKKAALKEAAEIVAYNGKEGVNLAAVLDKPLKEFNAEVSELTKEMNGMDATTVQSALRQAYKLANDERAALGKASELKAQLESKAASAARQAFDEIRGELKTKISPMQMPENASEEKASEVNAYNAALSEALAEAEKFSFGRMTEKDVARISHQAAMLKPVAQHLIPSLQRDLARSNALLAEATSELEAIKKGKNPGKFTGPTGGTDKADIAKLPIDQGLKALSSRVFAGQG